MSQREINDLERLLAALPLKPSTLDRDQLFYRAGQASAADAYAGRRPVRPSWAWPIATLAMSAFAACLAAVLVLQPAEVVRIVQVPVQPPGAFVVPPQGDEADGPDGVRPLPPSPSATPDLSRSPALSAWRLQQEALRFGVEEMPMGRSGETAFAGAQRDELSAGSRPMLNDHISLFPFGER